MSCGKQVCEGGGWEQRRWKRMEEEGVGTEEGSQAGLPIWSTACRRGWRL